MSGISTALEAVSSDKILDTPAENLNNDAVLSVPMDIPSPNYYELYLSERSKNEELQRKMELIQDEKNKYSGIARKCIDDLLLLL